MILQKDRKCINNLSRRKFNNHMKLLKSTLTIYKNINSNSIDMLSKKTSRNRLNLKNTNPTKCYSPKKRPKTNSRN